MFKRTLVAIAFISGVGGPALAQSSPGLYQGFVPTPAQWNSYFVAKQDALGYTPVNKAGDTMLGRLSTAPSSAVAGLTVSPGTLPSTLRDGDVWMTTSGLFYRYNGLTIGPVGSGAPVGTMNGIPYYSTSSTLASTTSGAVDSVFMGGAPPGFSAALTNCTTAVTYSTGSHAWGCNASVISGVTTSYPLGGGGSSGTVALTSVAPTTAGRLAYSSATAITFSPFMGDTTKVNGAVYQIPSAGITGCANTGVYVNGTPGQNLAVSTFYYVYQFSNAGTLTCDFSTTGHSTSATAGNVGTEIKTGDNSRSLIGMVKTNSSGQFVDAASTRYVRSWFNRYTAQLANCICGSDVTGLTSTSFATISANLLVHFLSWAGETADFTAGINISNGTVAIITSTAVGFNGTSTTGNVAAFNEPTSTYVVPTAPRATSNSLAEGDNFAQALYAVNSGSATVLGASSAITGTVR